VKGDRIRGNDLPFGITHTIRYSREGKEQHFITVQACCNNVRRSKAFMYGHSRTREEAITKAKSTLAVFLSEIEDQVKLSKENL
jgi:acyl-coenzyme A thioesterase PaaI-like protein